MIIVDNRPGNDKRPEIIIDILDDNYQNNQIISENMFDTVQNTPEHCFIMDIWRVRIEKAPLGRAKGTTQMVNTMSSCLIDTLFIHSLFTRAHSL